MKLNPTVQDFLDYRAARTPTSGYHLHAIGMRKLLEAKDCFVRAAIR